jgi:hypothetical protein
MRLIAIDEIPPRVDFHNDDDSIVPVYIDKEYTCLLEAYKVMNFDDNIRTYEENLFQFNNVLFITLLPTFPGYYGRPTRSVESQVGPTILGKAYDLAEECIGSDYFKDIVTTPQIYPLALSTASAPNHRE